MKTITVKPILIDSKEPTFIGSIMECIKPAFAYIEGIDVEVGKLTLNINPLIKTSNYWQHKELILISLDDEIKDGDGYYFKGAINKADTAFSLNTAIHIKAKKIIARQHQIPNDYIQQFIEEYNNGKVEDIEIEMIKHLIIDSGENGCYCDDCDKYIDECDILKPKLTNDFINIVNKGINKPKYPIGGYAPGNYTCNCVTCKTTFIGDKRAVKCESCAIENNLINSSSYNIIGKPLNDYIRDKHTQEECIGFIDGYKARVNEEEILYTEQEVLDIARNSYNLRTFDKYVRSSKSFEEWFNKNKKK